MDSEKLKIFMGMNKKKTPAQKAVEASAEKLMSEGQLMKSLRDSKGWKLFDEFFRLKREYLGQELKTCKAEELIRLQERSKVIDELYAFMNSLIIRGN
jgi:Skp family chaperone for outer membrane proteins